MLGIAAGIRVVVLRGLGISVLAFACSGATAVAAGGGLTQFLVRSGEETGFVVHGRQQVTSRIGTWLKGDPSEKSDSKLLSTYGFKAVGYETLSGPKGDEGGSSVVEMGSATGARKVVNRELQLAHTGQGSGHYRSVAVHGVPGAVGFTFTSAVKGGGGDTNVYWTEGRCALFAGDAASQPAAGPVIAGVQAVYRRTHGTCP